MRFLLATTFPKDSQGFLDLSAANAFDCGRNCKWCSKNERVERSFATLRTSSIPIVMKVPYEKSFPTYRADGRWCHHGSAMA